MRRVCIRGACSVTLLLGAMAAAASGQSLDRPVLEQLKDATVFIKFKAGNARGGGSGLVIRVDGDKALVLTNHHVASPDLPGDQKAALSVVFRSGTDREQEVPATILASLMNNTFDLAILEVRGVKQPPRPISTEQAAPESEFFETMPLVALGFPMGEMVQGVVGSNRGANPQITVNSMNIGSLRKDAAGQLVRIQLNGSVIQGISGGPIVDAKGRLVGIAVSRIINEAVGFAIPPGVINSFINGTVVLSSLELTAIDKDSAELKLSGKVVDPFGKLRSASVRRAATTPADEVAGGSSPPKSKEGMLLKDPSPVALTLGNGEATARFRSPISADGSRKVTLQLTWTDAQGNVRGMFPIVVPLPDRPGVIRKLGGAEEEPTEVAKWSCEVNITGGAKIAHLPGATAFELPGGNPYINAPQLSAFTAPAALVRVKGDCQAVVVVDGRLDPGGEPIVAPNGRKLNLTYQGAGLLLWQDDGNFVRLERCKKVQEGGGLIHQALIEVYKNGKVLALHYSEPLPDIATILSLERKGSTIRVLYSRDPRTLVVFHELVVDFRDDVLLGVSASNLSKRALKIDLKAFKLINGEGAPVDVQPYNRKSLTGPDVEKLDDGTLVFEGSTLKVFRETTGGSAIPQENLEPEGGWSGGRQLLWKAAKKGDNLTLEYPVNQPGNYEVQLLFSKGPDYGRVGVAVDGKAVNQGKPFELYSDRFQLGKSISLGAYNLAKGPHKLQFNILGKHDQSSGFAVGIDDVRLVPAKAVTSTKSASPKAPASTKPR